MPPTRRSTPPRTAGSRRPTTTAASRRSARRSAAARSCARRPCATGRTTSAPTTSPGSSRRGSGRSGERSPASSGPPTRPSPRSARPRPTTCIAVARLHAAEAARRTASAWSEDRAVADAVAADPTLWGPSAGFDERLRARLEEWIASIGTDIAETGEGKRRLARGASIGVNAIGVGVMLATFIHTAGLTGTEVGVAAATAFLNQKLLGALFGEAAMVELIARARQRLDDALVETFAEERARFDALAPSPEELDALAADLRDAAAESCGTAGGRADGRGRDVRPTRTATASERPRRRHGRGRGADADASSRTMSVAEPLPYADRPRPMRASRPRAPGLGRARRSSDPGIGACLQRLDDAIAAAADARRSDRRCRGPSARDLGERLGFPAETYVLALVGGTGVGKSSLLNALAGSSVSDASARRPTTARAARVGPPREPRRPGRPARLARRRRSMRSATTTGTRSGDVAILDLPDLDSIEQEHRERVEAVLPRVDAVVWVTDPEKYHDAILHDDFLATWLPRLDRQVVVLNKTDRLSADDADRIRARPRARHGAGWPGLAGRGQQVRVLLDLDAGSRWLPGSSRCANGCRRRSRRNASFAPTSCTADRGRRRRARAGGRHRPDGQGQAARRRGRAASDESTASPTELLARHRPARRRAPGRGGHARPRARPGRRAARRRSPRGSIAGRVDKAASRIPGRSSARWRERGSLAPALDVLRVRRRCAAARGSARDPRGAGHERRAGVARDEPRPRARPGDRRARVDRAHRAGSGR